MFTSTTDEAEAVEGGGRVGWFARALPESDLGRLALGGADGEAPYRDAVASLRPRLLEALRREERLANTRANVEAVWGDRVARIAGATVALIGVIGMATVGAIELQSEPHGWAALALIGAATAALLTWGATHLVLRRGVPARVLARLSASGDLVRDLARLDADAGGASELARTEALGAWSRALPLVALSLVGPLLLHFPVALLLHGGEGLSSTLISFDAWIGMSAVVVGHCHLLLAALSVRYALRLPRLHAEGKLTDAGWPVLGWVTLASLVPGVLLLFLPVIVVVATGAALIPWMFRRTANRWYRETAALAHLATQAASLAA